MQVSFAERPVDFDAAVVFSLETAVGFYAEELSIKQHLTFAYYCWSWMLSGNILYQIENQLRMVNCDPVGTFRAQEFMKCHGGALLCFYYVGHLKYENVLYKILVLLSQKKWQMKQNKPLLCKICRPSTEIQNTSW